MINKKLILAMAVCMAFALSLFSIVKAVSATDVWSNSDGTLYADSLKSKPYVPSPNAQIITFHSEDGHQFQAMCAGTDCTNAPNLNINLLEVNGVLKVVKSGS